MTRDGFVYVRVTAKQRESLAIQHNLFESYTSRHNLGAASFDHLVGAGEQRWRHVVIRLSFLFLCVNRVPVILISFRDRFLALAPTIT
jgi:hypothetical protein